MPANMALPPTLTRAVAWFAVVLSLFTMGVLGLVLHDGMSTDFYRTAAWAFLLASSNLVLATVVLVPHLWRRPGVLRGVGATFLLGWGAAAIVTGVSFDGYVWQRAVHLGSGVALVVLGLAVAWGARWGLRLAAIVAWLQVLFHFGTMIAGVEPAETIVGIALQLTAFVLLGQVLAELATRGGSERPSVPKRATAYLRAAGFGVALLGVGSSWAIYWSYTTPLMSVACVSALGLGIAWLMAGMRVLSVPRITPCIELPRVRGPAAAGKLAVFVVASLGLFARLVLPLAAFVADHTLGFAGGRGVLGVLPIAIGVGSPVLVLVLVVGFTRECVRSRRQRILADDAGFRLTARGESWYVPFAECEWGELRRTLWGAEVVLRSPGFQQIAVYPLLDGPSVLCAARALRRCENARARRIDASAASALSRPRGAALGLWIRSIQDLVRGDGRPYHDYAPTPDALFGVLNDVQYAADERAGAAAALVALGKGAAVCDQLRRGSSPPLVTVAAGLAGAILPANALDSAMAYLGDDDRMELSGMAR